MPPEPLYKPVADLIQRFEAKNLPNIADEIAEIWSDINAKAMHPNLKIRNNQLLLESYMQRISPYWTFLE